MPYDELIGQYAGDIDPRVAAARIKLESGGDPTATAKPQQWQTGYGSEVGLLQLSPDARKQYGLTEEQARDPGTNLKYGLQQWNAWSNKVLGEMGENAPRNPMANQTWRWLTTAVGPGATRKIRDLTGGDYSLAGLAKVANSPELLEQNKNYWGSQSPQLVSHRIKTAIKTVVGAMREGKAAHAGSETMAGKYWTPQGPLEMAAPGTMTPEQEAYYRPKPMPEKPGVLPGRLAPEEQPLEPKLPPGLDPDVSLDKLNRLIGGMEQKVASEENPKLKNAYTQKLRELQVYRLKFSGPHQPPGGTKIIMPDRGPIKPMGLDEPLNLPAPEGQKKTVELKPPAQTAAAPAQDPLAGLTVAPSRTYSATQYGYDPTKELESLKKNITQGWKERVAAGKKEAEVLVEEERQKQAIIKEKDALYGRLMDRNKRTLERLGNQIPGVQDRITKADEILGNIRGQISKVDTEPAMSTGRTIAFAIAAAFSGFAAGFRGISGNAALDMMNKYLDRKMQAKKAQIDKLKDLHKMTKEQRDYLDDVLVRYKKKEETALLQDAQYQLAKIGSKDDSLQAQLKLSNGLIGIQKVIDEKAAKERIKFKEQALETKTKLAPKVTEQVKPSELGTFATKEIIKSRLAKPKAGYTERGKMLSEGTLEKFSKRAMVVKRLANLVDQVKGKDLSPIKEVFAIFGTDAGNIMPQIKALARQIGRELGTDKGNFAEKEGEVMVKAITGGHWNKAEQSWRRLKEHLNGMVDDFGKQVVGLDRSGYDVSGVLNTYGSMFKGLEKKYGESRLQPVKPQ